MNNCLEEKEKKLPHDQYMLDSTFLNKGHLRGLKL